MIQRNIGAAAVAVAALFFAGQASAEEGVVPHLGGVNGGAPTGAVPEQAIFLVNTTAYIDGAIYDTNGHSGAVQATAFVEIPEVAWAPGVKILGANLLVAVAQPIDFTSINLNPEGIGVISNGNAFATVITPFRLGWDLPNSLFVAARTDVYIPDGGYANPLAGHPAGNLASLDQFVFEPSLAVSYLGNGWNISFKGYFDISLQNQSNDYTSGAVFGTEDSILKNFGKWSVGVTGFTQNQISADTGSAVALINGPQAAADGHYLTDYGIGPYVGYNFGPVILAGWYNQTFGTVNAAGGGRFLTGITIPL